MEIKKIESIIEAILFTMGESVEVSRIAKVIEHDVETTRKIIHNMMDRYEEEDRGIRIIELNDSFQMCTKKEMYEYLIKIAKQPRRYNLSDVALETLSIVAYKQPVTRQEIEKIRGVKSDHAINKLIEYDLIQEVGRLDVPGRPILFGTTEEFLRRFNVQSADELPGITPEKVREIQRIALEPVSLETPIGEFNSFFGKIFKNIVVNIGLNLCMYEGEARGVPVMAG